MSGVPMWAQAGFWGLVAGSALLLGAAAGYWLRVPQRVIAAIMAFGSGVLISALSFDLMEEAYNKGGFRATAFGFLAGATVFTAANWILASHGAKHRKRSGSRHPPASKNGTVGTAIALGALLDGIPESIVIGLTMLEGSAVSKVAVAAIFLSNFPEGMSSAAGMRTAGRRPLYIFGIWTGIAVSSSVCAVVGFTLFSHASGELVAATTAVAAGAILAMLVDTMIPEAFEETHDFAGLITVAGFLAAFALSKSGL